MAYTMKVDGMEELSGMLQNLGDKAQGIASKGLYEGAGVMAKKIASAAKTIRTKPFRYAVFITRDPSPEEKAVVEAAGAVGIARFDKNGSEVNTAIGYGNAGYAEMAGKLVPIAKIANAINSGTSFMQKQPFIRKAMNSGKAAATDAILAKVEEEVNTIMNT